MRGPRTRFTFEMKKQVYFSGPSIVSVFICRHLPQETNDLTDSCVTEKESLRERVWERGCPRSLVTICLRRSSCQLLFLPVIQFSLSLPVQGSHMVWAATSQHRSVLDMHLALFLFLPLTFLCTFVFLCQVCVNAPAANGRFVFSSSWTKVRFCLWKYSTVKYKCFVFCLTVA